MIKVTSEVRDNREMNCADVATRVFIGDSNSIPKEYRDDLIKAELKCLITVLIKKHPDLLFSALDEVISEGLHHD